MRKTSRLLLVAAMAVGVCAPAISYAADYPTKDIKVIIPKNPGGGTDVSTRTVITLMEKDLGGKVKFVPVNKPDGNGIVGMADTAHAKADGYTLGAVTVELAQFPHQGKTELTYKDFASVIAPIAAPASLVVPADAPYNTLDEFVAYLKQHPGEVMMGNSGMGAMWHIATMAFEKEFGVTVKHIPFPKGSADIAAALTGGHIQGTIGEASSLKAQIEAGKMKVLAIMADSRTGIFPDVPTFKELGHNLTVRAWAALVAPKGTPKEVMDVLCASAKRVSESAEYKDLLIKQGIDPVAIIGADCDKMMADDDAMYAEFLAQIK